MKSLIALSAAGVLIALSAYARLGESPSEIEKRYGKPIVTPEIVDTNQYKATYSHDGFEIKVTFWKGKSASEILVTHDSMTHDDALSLFKSISGETNQNQKITGWKGSEVESFKTQNAWGIHSSSRFDFLLVETQDYHKHELEKEEAEKKKKQDGI